MLRPILFAIVFAAIGCVRPSSEPDRGEAVVVAAPSAEPVIPVPEKSPSVAVQPEAAKPVEPPPTFRYPPDLGGQALPRVVTPVGPPLPATSRLGQAQLVRTPPANVVDPQPPLGTAFKPSPVMLPRPAGLKPAAPPEKVPLDVGNRAEAVPAKPVLPEAPGVAAKGSDVNEPPKLPPQGRPQPDRASLDDPTADLGNAAIAGQSKTPLLAPSPFVKFGLPDPFELAAQVKPRVPPAAEPGQLPVPVNPERKK